MKACLLAVLCQFVASCAFSNGSTAKQRRFHEASRASVVLQFFSWDYTFMTRPAYQESGYLQQVGRDNIGPILSRLRVRRDLAVVVIGRSYGREEVNRVVAEWKSILGDCGFHRMVAVRSNDYNTLNGSLILDDSILSASSTPEASALSRAGR